jgi:hypothetical protein
LFFSAFGFFFSRLLLNWPFAPCPPFACVGYGVLLAPHTTAVHVEQPSDAVHDLLRMTSQAISQGGGQGKFPLDEVTEEFVQATVLKFFQRLISEG